MDAHSLVMQSGITRVLRWSREGHVQRLSASVGWPSVIIITTAHVPDAELSCKVQGPRRVPVCHMRVLSHTLELTQTLSQRHLGCSTLLTVLDLNNHGSDSEVLHAVSMYGTSSMALAQHSGVPTRLLGQSFASRYHTP